MGRWSDGDTSLRAFVKEPPLCTVTNMNEVGKLHLFNRKKENTFSIGIGGYETNAICTIQLLGFWGGGRVEETNESIYSPVL